MSKKLDITEAAHGAVALHCKSRGTSMKAWASRRLLEVVALEEAGIQLAAPKRVPGRAIPEDGTLAAMATLSHRPPFWVAQGREPKKPLPYRGHPQQTHEMRSRKF